jgi:nickel-dependent lactate racemase
MTAEAIGGPAQTLAPERVDAFVREALGADDYTGRSVCVLVPDATRSCPLPLLLDAVHGALAGRVARLTVLVALGTHAGLSEPDLAALVGAKPGGIADRYPGMAVRNHEWWDPAQLTTVGRLSAATVARLSGGRLRTGVDVTVNRAAVEHDTLLVVGPVFPHEVVGFSGGNKYLFPGIAGPEVIDLSHWLGALIGSAEIIGTRGTTPVRAVIDAAAALVPARRRALCVVVESGSDALHSVAYGSTEDAWASAAEVAAQAHVRYLGAPVPRVLSLISTRYDELWTAAKGMYKVEPVVADGGEVVLYAPHVRTVSHTHDAQIRAIGYHCREFFTAQWDRYRHHPWGVLAHSTHLRGAGSYDPVHGERCRITVTLATGIDEATTRSLGLNHRDSAGIDPAAWSADPDTLVVHDAGEILYRLR